MTDKAFQVKNGLQVNSILTVDPATGLITTSANVNIGSNVILTIQDITIGTSGVNTYINSTSLVVGNSTVSALINSTSFSGTANNALNFSGAISLGNSTVNAIVNSTIILMSGNHSINSTSFNIGNSTINTVANSSVLSTGISNFSTGANVGSNVNLTTAGLQVGNSTINTFINSVSIKMNGNPTLTIGNSTISATINSTVYSGLTLIANNAAFLGSVAAASYLTSATAASTYLTLSGVAADSSKLNGSSASSYQTISGLSANVANMTCNNALFLGGVAFSSYAHLSGSVNITITGTLAAGNVTSTGNVTATGNVIGTFVIGTSDVIAGTSDARLKIVKGLITGTEALDMLDVMSSYRYNLRSDIPNMPSDDRDHVGLMVQEVEPMLPEVISPAPFDIGENGVSLSGEDYKTIRYEKLVPILVAAIKELRSELDELKGRPKW
jgi:hypothetical protein